MFQRIKGISIGQGDGMAFGGGIYGANCEIGFSNSPTKITLNIVSEDGHYKSIIPNVSTAPYNINMNGKIFRGMYLYAYEKHKTAGSWTVSVSFIDQSVVLDKIYIGLLHRHGNTYRETKLTEAQFTVRCPSCGNGDLGNTVGWARRYLDEIPHGCYFEKSVDGGGYIILGKEGFVESNCELPKVDYNFSELCQALTSFGIKHELNAFEINSLYRQEYAGTLREVLNNWGSDFSFEFFFDNDTLKAIDLRVPINLTSIQTFAEHNEYVTDMSYSETLENSYTQAVVARYLKSSSAVEYNNTYHFKRPAELITLGDILGPNGSAYRAGDMLCICCALAKYDSALREAYIANWAIENNNMQVLESLGIAYDATHGYPGAVDAISKQQIFNYLQQIEGQRQNSPNVFTDKNNWEILVGVLNETRKEEIERWDQAAAEFMGKYFTFAAEKLPSNRFDCPTSKDWFVYYTYDAQWTTIPPCQEVGANSVPFASLLLDPAHTTQMVGKGYLSNMFEVSENVWGIEQNTYNTIKGSPGYDVFRPRFIKWDDSPAPAGLSLKLFNATSPMTPKTQSMLNAAHATATETGGQVVFIAIPILSKFPTAPTISNIKYSTINKAVYDKMAARNGGDNKSPKCLTYCESSIVSELCNCGGQYTPVPYFQTLLAPHFLIGHSNGGVSNMIFPVHSKYFGYFVQQRYLKTTYPAVKSIYGKPPVTPSNTLGIKVLDYDITPDLEAVMDTSSNAVNEYIYSPTRGAIMSAQEYYDTLTNLNNLVIPPQKSISITVSRTDLQNLGIPLSPVDGLTAMSISFSDGGIQTHLSYATRPPVVPKAEAIYAKVKYRLRN